MITKQQCTPNPIAKASDKSTWLQFTCKHTRKRGIFQTFGPIFLKVLNEYRE